MHQLASCQIDKRRVGYAAKVDGRRVRLRRANDHGHAGAWNVDGLQYGLLLLTAGRTSKRYAKTDERADGQMPQHDVLRSKSVACCDRCRKDGRGGLQNPPRALESMLNC